MTHLVATADRYQTLHGSGQVQSINADDLERQNALDVSEALFRNIGSVDINAAQNNPLQNDIHSRGFLASPSV